MILSAQYGAGEYFALVIENYFRNNYSSCNTAFQFRLKHIHIPSKNTIFQWINNLRKKRFQFKKRNLLCSFEKAEHIGVTITCFISYSAATHALALMIFNQSV